ncbi:MAG: BON domain-containing protein [Rhodanobacteraceae bacterium]
MTRVRYVLFSFLLLPFVLSGCVAAVLGGAAAAAATGAKVAHDRRDASTVLNDRNLQLSVDRAIDSDQSLDSHNRIRVVVYNRVILLVGEVVSEDARELAGKLASGFIGARRLVNQLDIMPEQGFWARRADNALGARIKTGLLDITSIPDFDPSRVSITVAHGKVYLMGLVTHAEADAVISNARNTRGVDQVINLFEYVEPADDDGGEDASS